MSNASPVSVVIPALGGTELLDANLPLLFREFEERAAGDELILVDDSGRGELEEWAVKALAGRPAKLVVRGENGGFAAALEEGIRAAENDLIFSMNSDVKVRPGFLAPLLLALDNPPAITDPKDSQSQGAAFAATPRVLLNGNEDEIESFSEYRYLMGLLSNRTRRGPGEQLVVPEVNALIPFAIGGTFLFRRSEFQKLGGFDSLFAPFYFEDNDLCWRAWRQGLCSVYVPESVVEHHHKGTIGNLVSPKRRRAAVERGELLFNWKHLDQEDLQDHIALLYRRALDAWLTDNRQAMIWLQLALDSLDRACQERDELQAMSKPKSSREILAQLNLRTS
jgi:GT2 family glycosyltransferase